MCAYVLYMLSRLIEISKEIIELILYIYVKIKVREMTHEDIHPHDNIFNSFGSFLAIDMPLV